MFCCFFGVLKQSVGIWGSLEGVESFCRRIFLIIVQHPPPPPPPLLPHFLRRPPTLPFKVTGLGLIFWAGGDVGAGKKLDPRITQE